MSDIFFGEEETLKSPSKTKRSNSKKVKPLSTVESLNLGNISKELTLNSGEKGLCKIRPKALKPSSHNPRPDWHIDDEWLIKHLLVDFDDLFENDLDSNCLVKIREFEEGGKVFEYAEFPAFSELYADPDPGTESDYNFLVDLAKSIREVGQVQPIEVETDHENGCFIVLEGHLRRLACIIGRLQYIDAVRNEGLQDLDIDKKVERQITENSLRKNLSPFGIFKLVSHFIEADPKISTRELANKIKISQTNASVFKKLFVNRSKISALVYISLEKDLLHIKALRTILAVKSINAQEKILKTIIGTDFENMVETKKVETKVRHKDGRKRTVSSFKISSEENCIKAGNKLINLLPDISERTSLMKVNSVEDMDKVLEALVNYLLED